MAVKRRVLTLKGRVGEWIDPLSGKIIYFDLSRFKVCPGKTYLIKVKKDNSLKLLKEIKSKPHKMSKTKINKFLKEISISI